MSTSIQLPLPYFSGKFSSSCAFKDFFIPAKYARACKKFYSFFFSVSTILYGFGKVQRLLFQGLWELCKLNYLTCISVCIMADDDHD